MDAIKEGMLASAKAAEAAARIGERLFGQNTPNVMNFNSQICTTREQSERLLALGLKKETADMWYPHFASTCPIPLVDETLASDDLPAWSLHRLWELLPYEIHRNGGVYVKEIKWDALFYICDDGDGFLGIEGNLYDSMIIAIEWLIKEGYFNKEYLEE